jgi:hypothetical protein
MSVLIELWPLAADETAIWLISGADPWVSWQIPADNEPHFTAEQLASGQEDGIQFDLLHSTSWRVDGSGHVLLTYVGIVTTTEEYVRTRWPNALPVTAELSQTVGRPLTHAAAEPPTPRDIDVLMHAIRHLRFLADTDESARSAMSPAWLRHLQTLRPALSGLYTDRHVS